MSEAILITQTELRKLVTEAVKEAVDPLLTLDDMVVICKVTRKTVTAMERRGEIPARSKSGYWHRTEVNDWLFHGKIAA